MEVAQYGPDKEHPSFTENLTSDPRAKSGGLADRQRKHRRFPTGVSAIFKCDFMR